ncbi:MAG: MBOAT family O-acyltransferase [Bacteroidota bacterium]|nr:MBOAT family O-acyltransferase [Bacteroidota bacterium]
MLAYHIVPSKYKNGFILAFSIFFYSWGGPKFIFAILATTFIDFFLVNAMHNAKNKGAKKKFLILSLCINLGLLFYFKYCNFFVDNFNSVLGLDIHFAKIILPIGISFYTFESLTYVVDVYRGIHKPLKSFWHYQTYILLFPKLIAGPIVRYHDIADQITNREKNYTPEAKLSGFLIFSIGLAKKVIIANTLGMQADAVFNLPVAQLDTAAAWVGAIAYTFQIYFDFSGYSDMAIGLCKIMGFRIPENFNNPYISTSITDFWRRWHITLGAWMKNYLYIPLGGNKGGNAKLYRNLFVVFLLSGLWHGASWNFVLWGAYHGFFLVLERLFLGNVFKKLGKFISVPITFIIVATGWVLFRNDDLSYAFSVMKHMYSFNFVDGKFAMNNDFMAMAVIALLISWFAITNRTLALQQQLYGEKFSNNGKWIVVLSSIVLFYVSLSYVSALNFNPFIYFRF